MMNITCFTMTNIYDMLLRILLWKLPLPEQTISLEVDIPPEINNFSIINYNRSLDYFKQDLKIKTDSEFSFRFKQIQQLRKEKFNTNFDKVNNPCYLKGYKNNEMTGSGDFTSCLNLMNMLLNNCNGKDCSKSVGGIKNNQKNVIYVLYSIVTFRK
jgi:hypothetical protein